MQRHVYSMFPVLSSPLNHTQTNQNKVMPSTYRAEFENKIKNMEKQNAEIENKNNISNMFYGMTGLKQNIGINYIHSYNYYQQSSLEMNNRNNNNNTKQINNTKTRILNNEIENINKNINRNLGWGGRENRFFSLSAMQNRGCGCG